MRINIAPPLLAILPVIALVPVSIHLVSDIHFGGISLLIDFLTSALTPSLDRLVILSAFKGIQISLAVALLSWTISLIAGFILGICSSDLFSTINNIPNTITKLFRYILALPRANHEIIWGLILLQLFGLNIWVAILAIVIPYSCLVARVFSDQIDNIDCNIVNAIEKTGAGSIQVLITIIWPKVIPLVTNYGGYRLECALRSATLLGVFGLGGIGTELQLSIQSLNFNEAWTSLWILLVITIMIEKAIGIFRYREDGSKTILKHTYIIFVIFLLSISSSITLMIINDINLLIPIDLNSISLINIRQILLAFNQIPLFKLIIDTILLTVVSSGIAIGLPPVFLMLLPSKVFEQFLSFIWVIFRVIPPPLTALLLLLCFNPSLSVAALALGIYNMSVIGRYLKESINYQENSLYNAIRLTGNNYIVSWLYGKLSPQSNAYLAYSAYRADIILRETSIVGIVGGVGLGWQLQESLSSFAWSEVIAVILTFTVITLVGEKISRDLNHKFLENQNKLSTTPDIK